jgi:hypothetical protein
MKKNIKIILCLVMMAGFVNNGFAQTTLQKADAIAQESTQQAKTLVRTINDVKSGNWQDVLTSFFQLAVTDLTGKSRSLDFKANLFALKAKADSTLLVDTNYIKHRFDRNFQFDFSLKLDSQYHFDGVKAGFTLNIINKRDSSLINLRNTRAEKAFFVATDSLSAGLEKLSVSVRNADGTFKSKGDSALFVRTSALIDSLLALGPSHLIKSELFPKEFIAVTDFKTIEKNYKEFDSLFNAALAKFRQRPLVTLSANGTFNDQPGLIKEGFAELVYLQSLSPRGNKIEWDMRINSSLIDTTVNNIKNRIEFNASLGLNCALITASQNVHKSLVEFKPYFAFKRVARCTYPGEKANQFTANAEVRIRLTDKLWIPLTLKYDLEDNNFLGFLNVSLNMDAFKKSTK